LKERSYQDEITFVLTDESEEKPRCENHKKLLDMGWRGDDGGWVS
jgi:hypothetical protein